MNLVCYPSYCAGALVCDLMNNKTSKIGNGPIDNPDSNFFKISCIGVYVQKAYDRKQWDKVFNLYNSLEWSKNNWVGTHVHPSAIHNLHLFDKVINITDIKKISKLYRFLRLVNIEESFKDDRYMPSLIKQLKDTFFDHSSCINIEFDDIVQGRFVSDFNLNLEHFENWKSKNPWLYNMDEYLVSKFNKMFEEN